MAALRRLPHISRHARHVTSVPTPLGVPSLEGALSTRDSKPYRMLQSHPARPTAIEPQPLFKPVLASACPRRKTANPQVGRILRLEYEFPSRSLRPSPVRKHTETPILAGESLEKKAVQDAESPRPADNVSYDPQSSTGIGTRVGQIVQPVDHSRTPVGQ